MAATIVASLTEDIEDIAKSEASQPEQDKDRFTTVNGQKPSGPAIHTSLDMDHIQEQPRSGSKDSDPSSEPAQVENEADDYSTDSGSDLDDDNTQPQSQISDRKRTQYKKFSFWSVLQRGK